MAHDFEMRERDLRIQVEADVRIALLDLASSAKRSAAARERLQLAEQEVSQARERFQAGVAGNADVITASLTLNVRAHPVRRRADAPITPHESRSRARSGSITSID